jgi:hypothetical protein
LEALQNAASDCARLRKCEGKEYRAGCGNDYWRAASPQREGKGGAYCADDDIALAVAADSPDHAGTCPCAMGKFLGTGSGI